MRRAAVPGLAAIVAPPFAAAPVTVARFTSSPTSKATFGTATLTAPTSLAGRNGTIATLTWVPSFTSGSAGHKVMRSATSGSGYAQVKAVTPVSATTTTDAPANGTRTTSCRRTSRAGRARTPTRRPPWSARRRSPDTRLRHDGRRHHGFGRQQRV